MHTSLMFWIWIGLTALFVIGEIFTAGFFLLPFGIGAGVAAIVTVLGGPAWLQWVGFVVVSGIMVFFSRKLADRLTREPPERVGVDRLIGEVAIVLETIDPATDSGMVRVKKDEWRATSASDERIEKGNRVRILRVEGAHVVVEKINT